MFIATRNLVIYHDPINDRFAQTVHHGNIYGALACMSKVVSCKESIMHFYEIGDPGLKEMESRIPKRIRDQINRYFGEEVARERMFLTEVTTLALKLLNVPDTIDCFPIAKEDVLSLLIAIVAAESSLL